MAGLSCEGNKDKNIRYQVLIGQDPEFAIVSLLNEAKVSVWMSSRLTPTFYNREKVTDAFIGAANRTLEFHLILDAGVNLIQRKKEMPWLNELIQKGRVVAKQSNKPIRHGLLVDSTHVRMEKEHDENLSKTRSIIVWNAKEEPLIIEMIQNKFNSWWRNVYPNNFYDARKVLPMVDKWFFIK